MMAARQKGFTLLELLVGMSLTALLMASLVIGLRVASRAWERGEEHLQDLRKDRAQASLLTRQVASLVPYQVVSLVPELPGNFPILEATSSRLRFLSSYDSRELNRVGLVLVEYAVVEAGPGRFTLALRETPVGDDEALLRALIQEVGRNPETGETLIIYRSFSVREGDLRLLEELSRAQFEYFDPGTSDRPPAWQPEWKPKTEAAYPAAIRLRWQRGGQREEMFVPVRARWLAQR